MQVEKIPLVLSNGSVVKVEAEVSGREDVAFNVKPFEELTSALEGIANSISETLERVKPDKASVKFGLEVGIDSGQLTTVIVKGSSKANLEITLEWNRDRSQED